MGSSNEGGGPSGTLVPFGVNFAWFFPNSILRAKCVTCMGVLLPCFPWRTDWEAPIVPLELPSEVTPIAD